MSDLDAMSEDELERACKLWSGYPGAAAKVAREALSQRRELLHALNALLNLQPTQESSVNPDYWRAIQDARAAIAAAQGET